LILAHKIYFVNSVQQSMLELTSDDNSWLTEFP